MANTPQPRSQSDSYADSGKIQARISDFENGLRVVSNVRLVRIKSKEYSLLIMEDYFPAMGSVCGSVELVTDTEQVRVGKVKGFFLHRENEFSLLIEDQLEAAGSETADNEADANEN